MAVGTDRIHTHSRSGERKVQTRGICHTDHHRIEDPGKIAPAMSMIMASRAQLQPRATVHTTKRM